MIYIFNYFSKNEPFYFKKIINLINTTDKYYLLIIFILSIISALAPLISIELMQKILNLIQININDMKIIFIYVFLYLMIDFLLLIVTSLLTYYNLKFSLNLNLNIQNLIHKKIANLSLKSFENSDVYNTIKRAEENTHNNIISLISVVLTILTSIISTSFYFIKLFKFNKVLIFIIILVPIIKFKVINEINLKQYSIIRKRTNEERKAWYYSYIITNGNEFKELKINNLFNFFMDKYNDLISKFNNQDINIEKDKIFKLSFLEFFEQILDGSIFIFIIRKCILKQILIGDAITYMKVLMNLKADIRNILNSFSLFKKHNLYINMFFELMELEEESFTNNKKENNITDIDEIKSIEFRNVFFKYRDNQEYILKNINFNLNRGDSIAIVGLNGSGKTTLSKLILGFYNDYEGEILINGVELRCLNIEKYRNHIGVLFQDFIKYEATLKENICYGNLELFNKVNIIKEIIDRFSLNSIFKNESEDYNLQLGYWFDSGRQISIGQWHRIALARTFVKNADLYLLDEPNSSLDPISEEHISNLFINYTKDKIGLIVTHRFINIVKKVDLILVINDGKIIEQGTHKELIQLNKEYRKLYNSQLGE